MKNETLPIQGLRSLHKTLQNSCSELYNYAQQNGNFKFHILNFESV